jgi:hypothetical protein
MAQYVPKHVVCLLIFEYALKIYVVLYGFLKLQLL